MPRKSFTNKIITTCRRTDTPEAAYVHAVIGAGALHAVAEACSRGQLVECTCDRSAISRAAGMRPLLPSPSVRSPSTTTTGGEVGKADELSQTSGDFLWGGCTDDVGFAYEETKKFMEVDQNTNSKGNDFRAMIQKHNREAGRLVSAVKKIHF